MLEWLKEIVEFSFALFGLVLFILFILSKELGYFAGKFIRRRGLVDPEADLGFLVGAMLGLLSFLLGITLLIAYTEYQQRDVAVLGEANSIGSAWLIAGAQADDKGAPIQRLLENYTRVRISVINDARIPEKKSELLQRTGVLQKEMWLAAADIAKQTPTAVSASLLNALTKVFDNSVLQRKAFDRRIPTSVAQLLEISALLVLFGTGLHLSLRAKRFVFMTSLLSFLLVGIIVVIVDFSRPYQGPISVNPDPLVWTLNDMQSAK